ncbi:hypothetical protein D3C72_1958390 [compost metagenome]
MTNNAAYLVVDEFLRQLGRSFRVCLVVFCHQFEGHRLAADGWLLGVSIFDRQGHAVFVLFTVVRLWAGQWRGKAELHDFTSSGAGLSGRRVGRGFFFIATCSQSQRSSNSEGKAGHFGQLHVSLL